MNTNTATAEQEAVLNRRVDRARDEMHSRAYVLALAAEHGVEPTAREIDAFRAAKAAYDVAYAAWAEVARAQ